MAAAVLSAGCASPSLSTAHFPTRIHGTSTENTIRSQDTPLADDWLSPSNSAAPSPWPVKTPTDPRSSTSGSGSRSPVRAAVPGHSFAQPKARLGRPITDPSDRQIAANAGHSLHVTEHNQLDPWSQPASNKNNMQNRASAERDAWQPVRPNSEKQTAEILLRPAPLPGSPDEQPPGAFHLGSGNIRSAPVSISESQPDGSPSQTAGLVSELPANAAEIAGSNTDPPSPEVPTMLDRLRGLYNPRLDENTDKLRKQIRRWPDPFGLLTDRDSAEALIPATPESGTGPGPSDLKSADTATSPLATQRPQGPSTTVQTLIAELEQELADWPRLPSGKPAQPVEWRQRQTDLRLLYMIAGRAAESIRIIESLPEEEQEYWQSLMLSMNRYRQPGEESARAEQLTQSLQHLRTAAKKLRPLAQLSIPRIILCDRIEGFGSVGEFPTANFEPGQRILIYTELQNFRSELTAAGRYRSEFAAVLEFMREGEDEVVDTIRVPQIEDLCDVERTDYFQSFELTLPALEGKYLMRLRLRDQLSLQTAVAELEFTVRSGN